MSLHKFAEQVAAQGRGDDSLLIHMTPDEVQRLQAFAEANGRSLTINPHTGLPEAGMLSDLFKAVAPIALGAFLGPGAFGIAGMGLSAGTAGLITGGITTLATGSLSRGLMAGLGAYGGAGLAEGLAGAGTAALGQQAVSSTAAELMNAGAGEQLTGEAYNQAMQEGVKNRMAALTPQEISSAGMGAAKAAPMDFLKQNAMPLAAAAAPIMAGQMVPTTTKMPENTNPAYIRQKLYDPYTQTYKSLTPVKASEWGGRSFSDAYTNPQTGGIPTLDPRQTTPMAAGGIVALAGGGVSDADVKNWFLANPGATDADIASAMSTYGVDLNQIARATGTQDRMDEYTQRFNAVSAPEPAYSSTLETGAPVYEEPAYTPTPARPSRAIEPEDTYVTPVAPTAPTAPTPVAPTVSSVPTRAAIEPEETVVAPTGIETLTAAMPPVTPVVPKVTDEQIKTWWSDPEHQKLSDTEIKKVMDANNVTPTQFANAIGANAVTAADISKRYEKAAEPAGIETLTAATPPVVAPTQKPTGIETLAAPATPVAPVYNKYTNEEIAKYLVANPNVDIAKAIKETNADPAAVNAYIASLTSPFRGSTETTGGSGTLGIYNQMKAQGIDPSEYYAAAIANNPKYAGWSKEDITRGYQLDKGAYALSDRLKGVVSDKDWAKFMDDNGYSVNDMAQAFGLSKNEVQARYDAAKKAETKTTGTTGTTGAGNVTTTLLPTNPTTNAPPGTRNPYGNVNNPGDITINPDGSKTVTPNIPGRPYGGFSGISEVANAYTAGGGSLGYTPRAPRTAADHAAAYNRMTGDSQAAYNYLMGKGANPVQSVAAATPTGIMRPYWSEAMRYKPKYLSYDKEGNVVTSSTSPNAPSAKGTTSTPSAKAINVLDSQGNTVEAVLGEDGMYHTSGGDTYDVTGKQVAAGGGMMGYAIGGGMGTLGGYSDGGRLLKGPGDGVSDSIPATIGANKQPARLADGEFVVPARIVSELGNGSTEAGAKKLYAMMDRVQKARGKTTGKNKVAANTRADKYLPA